MFDPLSRYTDCEDAMITINDNNGKREVPYKRRRFIPSSEKMNILQEVFVNAGDRLDLISYRALGNPEQFWRICDANDAMYPPDLTSEPGTILQIAAPWTG
jgi:hypothetical protein